MYYTEYEVTLTKKYVNIIIGVCSPLFYYFVSFCLLFMEYNEKYAFSQNALLFILPALPGIAPAFLLIRETFKDFLKSLGVCFLTSALFIILVAAFRINLMIYTIVTGYEEFSLGEGLLFAVTSISYFISCFVGAFISGIITFIRQKSHSSGVDEA